MRFLARALYTIVLLTVAAAAGAVTVSGIVTSAATGNALNGMVVAAYDPSGNLAGSATTDATGYYELSLDAGQYRLLAYDLAGVYATMFDANAESFETTPSRTIPASGAEVSFALIEGGTIAGRVQTAGGPLADAVVEAYNLSGTRRGFTTTNATGDYSLVLPPGQYKVIAYDANGMFAASFFSGARSFADATPVPVAEGESTGIPFLLGTPARVTGKAVDAATGVALPSILVYAYTPAGALVAVTETDSTGTFRLVLPAGDYRFVAADDERVYATGYYDRSASFEASTVVLLSAGQQWNDARIALPRAGRVTGTVRNTNAQLLAGITVGAYDDTGALAASATTGTDGRYELVVVPGAYRLVTSDPALTYATSYAGGASSYETTGPVLVEADAMITTDFTMRRGVRARGSVTRPDGSAADGIEVFALDASGNRVAAATSHDGEFTLVVAPGTYRFVAIDPARRYTPSEPSAQITIVQGQTPAPIALRLQTASRRRAVRH